MPMIIISMVDSRIVDFRIGARSEAAHAVDQRDQHQCEQPAEPGGFRSVA